MSEIARLNNLHHFAWKCANVDETIAFYEGILGLPYVHTIEKDHVPSTGQYAPYKHIFFQAISLPNSKLSKLRKRSVCHFFKIHAQRLFW